MGTGYIQLIAVGSEANIFNYNPNISFFKIYYRRHTNFYINNMDIEGNSIKSNNIITFNIPLNGDLLGKSYLNLTIDEHFFELFQYNDELCSTLNINLLNVYDSYYIKTNNYSINEINGISIIKINYTNKDNILLSIVSSNIFNQNEILNYVKYQHIVDMQTDTNDIFYNMNLDLLFYSFNVFVENSNSIMNNDLFQYIINNIIYMKLSYIQIDFKQTKISIRIEYILNDYYKMLLNFILTNFFIDIFDIKIDINYVYLSLNFSVQLYNELLELFYIDSEIFELEIINNKNVTTKNIFNEKINKKITNMILNKNIDTTIYLSILNGNINSYTILTIMKNVAFFGNLTNENYNDLLIQNTNNVLNYFNLNNIKLSIDLIIKIYINLISYNKPTTIQNFLKIVNNDKLNIDNILSFYSSNINLLNDKLIEYIMNPDVLILNNKTFYLILYSKNIYEMFQMTTFVQPFTNNHLSNYTNIIENFYFGYNTIEFLNSVYNNNSNDYDYINTMFYFLSSITKMSIQKDTINYDLTTNYINNNNLFDIVTNNLSYFDLNKDLFFYYVSVYNDTKTLLFQSILNNTLLTLIVESIVFNNENFNYISNIYDSNGKLSNLYINSYKSRVIFPCSSSIYIFTNSNSYICSCSNNKFTNNNLLFNRNFDEYLHDVKINFIELLKQTLNKIKINISYTFDNDLNKYITNAKMYTIIQNYYNEISKIINETNIKNIDNFLNDIKNINYEMIYSTQNEHIKNLNNIIMYQQFKYVDKNLFNNSFSNFEFNKLNDCTNFINEINYEKFIFTINSPLYRIYFFYTLIAKFNIDLNLLLNVKIDVDLNVLRDLTLSFILYYFNIFNGFNINFMSDIIDKFNLKIIDNIIYFIQSNFLSYDEIDLFENKDFIYKMNNKNSDNYTFIYNNFYFVKTNMLNYKINNIEFLNSIPDITNKLNYNYDDIIILLFMNVLFINKNKFVNFNDIYNFTLDTFSKNNFNFTNITNFLNNFIRSGVEKNNAFLFKDLYNENNFYYNCYYTIFAVGTMFDNININNVNTINNVVNLTSIYNNPYLFKYEYVFKEYNLKQYNNFLDLDLNIIDVFKYYQSKLFNIFSVNTQIDDNIFLNYLNILISNTNTNSNYLFLYLLTEFDYNNSISVINVSINKFNSINNTNISLTTTNNNINFYKITQFNFNFINIIYYFIYFVYKCMDLDILKYNAHINNLNSIPTFGEYIIAKYTTNIYFDCVDGLINLLSGNNNSLNIDFSKMYFYLINNKNDSIDNFTNQNVNTYVSILKNNAEIKNTFENLNYSQINDYYVNFNNYKYLQIELINKNFNLLYSNILINIIAKTNKIFYSIYTDSEIFLKIFENKNIPLETNYNIYKTYYFENSIYYLKSIYNNLLSSTNITNYYNQFVKRMITYIFNNLKNFFNLENYCYFTTLYYLNTNTILDDYTKNLYDIALNEKIISNNDYNLVYNNLNILSQTNDLYSLYSTYINILISTSLIYEKVINKIIYLLCTDYLITNSFDKIYTENIIKKKTLYDVVKLYINSSKQNKTYLVNTSIYSNQSIFQIFNYDNMYNNISFEQNYWINEIISNIDIEINNFENNKSYHNLFLKFVNYVEFYELDLLKFTLDDNTPILNYFKNIDNYNELIQLIFNYVCLNEAYSPNLIFANIVNLMQSEQISSKLMINTNHLKKKILTFLFFTWIILTETTELLIKNFDIDKRIILEYNLEQNTIDIELSDVLNHTQYMQIINWSIYQIYNMEPTYANKNLTINNIPLNLQNHIDIITIIKQAKIICSPITTFNLLSNKYINSYHDIIGNSNMYNNDIITSDVFKPTITNLISNINMIFNNDININNPNQYDLTFYSLKLLGINFSSSIYDLDNTINNKLISSSDFTYNAKINYTKTVINDFNLLYNLSCLLLNNYSIEYDNLQNDYNIIQNYLRKGTNSLNQLLETFKGYVSNYSLTSELTSLENIGENQYFISKLMNIQNQSFNASNLNNLSIITPNDYDLLPIEINYNYAYKNFYEKYYLYEFNYNNFIDNYKVIYKKLYTYYLNIINNEYAIKNIKNYKMKLYIWMFIDLINALLSNTYYGENSNYPNEYIIIINKIIQLYFTYNYSFRLNSNISNIKNMIIQNKYSNIPSFTNYVDIKNFLLSYYYYQLFSTDINDVEQTKFKQDVITFFNTLEITTNTNFIYTKNFLNCVFKFEVIIRFIIHKIKNNCNYNILNTYNKHINEANSILIDYLTNFNNIQNYFNLQYIDKINNETKNSCYTMIFNLINNLLDKKIFFTKFIYSLKELIYWINDKSYDNNVIETWTKYFQNVYFDYYEFVENQYIVQKYMIDVNTLYYLIETYIYFIFQKNTEFKNKLNDEYFKLYMILFSNNETVINPEIINNLLMPNYDTIIDEPFYLNKLNDDLTMKLTTCVDVIFKFILNNCWGIINYNIIENTPQTNLINYIGFYNIYYSYLNYLIINTNSNTSNYNFESNIKIFDELYILYYMMINIYTLENIELSSYYTLQQQCLTYSHQYIWYGMKINTFDLTTNFAIYMDNINSNVIPSNAINNYYKNIQNETIYESFKYNLNNFKNNKNNYSDYVVSIYNNQIIKLNLYDENTLGSNTFYNIIINTYNNYTSSTNLYIDKYNIMMNDIINTIYTNINAQFTLLIKNFGGINNIGISINETINEKIFNINNYKNENSQITIFSLINNQLKNNNLYNNVPVLIFYYSCYITWCTLGLTLYGDYEYVNNLFYNLANIINRQILLLLEPNTNVNTTNELFFEGLNILMFKNYNNYEFIKATQKYFNSIIDLNYNNINNLIIINNLVKNGDTNNNNILGKIELNNVFSMLKINNNKIINWKYLMGILCDFNESIITYYIKSIDNIFADIKIQEKLINYIIKLNNGLINNYGIIQIINRMELLFNDEIISQYFNFNYKIFIDNFQNINKQGLLDNMLGIGITNENQIISGIKPYIKYSYKQKYQIPIKFFFENYFNSIPLISCMNTNIIIKTYLNNTNIYKNSYFINNLTKININTKLNLDYILIERDERKKLSLSKIDNLIERNNYYELIKNISEFETNKNNIINVNFDFELDNLVKELIWTFKITINQYEITICKNITLTHDFFNPLKNITLDDLHNSDYDFIINTKFYLDGLRRDGIIFLDSNTFSNYNKITTVLNPYKYNTKVILDKNYNTYSFALEPTDFQPSGAINMSNYNIFRIQIQIDKLKFLKYLNEINLIFNLKDINFKMFLTTYEYNVVRYQSSLAGLLFVR